MKWLTALKRRPQHIEQITAAIQNIVISLAVIVGGIWTVYSFVRTKSAEQAYYELQIERKEIEPTSKTQISLEVEQIPAVTPRKYAMLVRVTIENKGDFLIPLLLNPNPMRISHIVSTNGQLRGDKVYYPLAINNYQPDQVGTVDSYSVWPGNSRQIDYYLEVETTGVYNVSFYFQAKGAVLKSTDTKEQQELGGVIHSTDNTPGRWVGTFTYAVILSDFKPTQIRLSAPFNQNTSN